MGVRKYVGCLAAVLCAACWPAAAFATINAVDVQPGSALADFLCIGSTTTSPVLLQLSAPDGTLMQSITLSTADDVGGGSCPASTHTFQPGIQLPDRTLQPAFDRYPAGGRITAIQDGRSVTVTLPYGSFSAGTTLLRGLPDPAGLAGGIASASVPGTYNGPAAVEGGAVTATGSATDSSGAAVAVTETLTPRQYRVVLDGSSVRVLGDDPLGPRLSATLESPTGATLGRASLRPRVGDDCDPTCSAGSTFDAPAPSGGTLTISAQPGWFAARTVPLPGASLRSDGFDVALPAASPGTTGSYGFDLRFFDPSSIATLSATNPLRCRALGPAVSCSGGPAASRLTAAVSGLFVIPGDTVDVTEMTPTGDTATVTATASGLIGSLDDGSLVVHGAPRALLVSSLNAPRAAPLPPFVATHSGRTDASGAAQLEDAFPVHIPNGAVATLSGPATGPTAQSFQWNLAWSVGAQGGLTGTTYPNARVAVDHQQGARTQHYETTATPAGVFSVPISDAFSNPLTGDVIDLAATDPTTRNTTTTEFVIGGAQPAISGVADGQFVRGTITPTVVGAGLDSVLWNGVTPNGLPSLLALTAPFPYQLDTSRWPDGPYRLEATGRPDSSSESYLYVTVDNTPPIGGAGADQTVAKSRTAVIVTGAGDATSGLASVKVDFGDGHRQTIAATRLASPLTHAYSKLGTFTVAVSITDRAGNSTSDTAKIRVASTVQPQIGGHFAGKLRRKRALAASLLGRVPGQLQIFILSQTGARKLTKWVTFTKANQRIKVSLATKGLKLGRFVLVEQFTDVNGIAGPVQAGALRVVKK